MILADADVILRWTEDSASLTGYGWFALLILAWAIATIGSRK